jgi:3-hydroxyacyl-[acyl-carrier-protein] dehydratase
MKFTLVDRIVSIDAKGIKASRNLSLAEEYLQDHFPGNPVMPGVLMLEGMIQAASWLVRVRQGFKHSMVLLKETRNVKYGKFVEPGDTLLIDVAMTGMEDGLAHFRGVGAVDGQVVVRGQFTLTFFNLADTDKSLAYNDEIVREMMKRKFQELGGNKALQSRQKEERGEGRGARDEGRETPSLPAPLVPRPASRPEGRSA